MVLHTPEKRFSSKPKLVFLKGYDNLARIRFSNDSEKANFCLKKKRTHNFQNIYAILVQVKKKSLSNIQTRGRGQKVLYHIHSGTNFDKL